MTSLNHRKLLRQLTADKKKLGLMLALVGVGLVLWARLLLQGAPEQAVAGTAGAAVSSQVLAAGEGQTGHVRRQTVEVDLPEGIQRDLFSFAVGSYRRTATEAEAEPLVENKSPAQPTDETLQAQAVRQSALSLTLQTTILGENPRAVINGQVLRPGQSIQGFVLIRVMPRGVVLSRRGIEVTLEM
jgi:hypothetical protein